MCPVPSRLSPALSRPGPVPPISVIFYVEKYRPVLAGKHRKLPENGSSILVRKLSYFSRYIPVNFCSFRQQLVTIHLERIRKILVRDTASMFRCFPEGYDDFSATFLPVSAIPGSQNDRPGCLRILFMEDFFRMSHVFLLLGNNLLILANLILAASSDTFT